MSKEKIAAYREGHVPPPARPRRTHSVLQGGCPQCGHLTYDLGRYLYCPDEDCHPGGGYVVKPRT